LKEAEEKRREHQRMLEEKQKEEAVARFNTQVKKTSKSEDTKNFEAYKDLSQYPKDMPRTKVTPYVRY
jgi:nucleosome binding factor SPN SPT16 subunit